MFMAAEYWIFMFRPLCIIMLLIYTVLVHCISIRKKKHPTIKVKVMCQGEMAAVNQLQCKGRAIKLDIPLTVYCKYFVSFI